MAEHLVFLGDIKGTKSALQAFDGQGRDVLARRMATLHEGFAGAYSEFGSRSRSLKAVTISDSVFACWSDVREGSRVAIPFMRSLWNRLDHNVVRFRGFLDIGEYAEETSPLAFGMALSSQRFVRAFPPSVALWSVAMAEAAHFPDGLFVNRELVERLSDVHLEETVYEADVFQYMKLLNI